MWYFYFETSQKWSLDMENLKDKHNPLLFSEWKRSAFLCEHWGKGREKEMAHSRMGSSFLLNTLEIGSQPASVWLLCSDCLPALTIVSCEMATSLLLLSFIPISRKQSSREKQIFCFGSEVKSKYNKNPVTSSTPQGLKPNSLCPDGCYRKTEHSPTASSFCWLPTDYS